MKDLACPLLRALPLLLCGVAALWGVWLFLTSPHRQNATATGLTADYLSPFLTCLLVWPVCGAKQN